MFIKITQTSCYASETKYNWQQITRSLRGTKRYNCRTTHTRRKRRWQINTGRKGIRDTIGTKQQASWLSYVDKNHLMGNYTRLRPIRARIDSNARNTNNRTGHRDLRPGAEIVFNPNYWGLSILYGTIKCCLCGRNM